MKFNNTKCKVLHLHQSNPQYEHRLENELIETSPVEKDVAILVKKKLDMSRQCAFPARKANCILSCIKKKCVTSRAREVVLPLNSVLMRLQLQYCSHLWGPWHRKTLTCMTESRGWPQEGLEHVSYGEQLRDFGLFSLEKIRLQGHLTVAFQYIKGAYVRKMKSSISPGSVVTGQVATVLA